MPPAHRLLVLLCLVGCLFTGWQMAARRSTAQTVNSAKQSGKQGQILQQQAQLPRQQISTVEQQNRDLVSRDQAPAKVAANADAPDDDGLAPAPETAVEHADISIARRALDHLGRTMDPVPRVVSIDEREMRTAIRGKLASDEHGSWATRQCVWKTMGLIPEATDLLASFEDMILEYFPVIFDQDSGHLAVLEDTTLHLGQVVPVLDSARREGGGLWTDKAGGGDDARWLAGIAHHLGRGLQARRNALLDEFAGETSAPPAEIEPRFFRAPIAVRELFRLLPLSGLIELEGTATDGTDLNHRPPYDQAFHYPPPTVLGIQPAWDGTWGRLLTRILLQQFLPEEAAYAAARGLVTDRIIAFQDEPENPDSLQVHWSSQWPTDEEADEFHSTLQRYFANQSGQPGSDLDLPDRALAFIIQGRMLDIRFASNQSRVIIVTLATNERWRKALLSLNTLYQN